VVTHGSLRIGFLEGFTVVAPTEADLLLAEANKLDVDVLCWGGTHRFDAYEYGDKFFVNPGSATGAFQTGWAAEGEAVVPSFCLMDVSISECTPENALQLLNCPRFQVQGISLTLYVYQLRTDANGVESVGVEKVSFTKGASSNT
jgi:vacuolar protein sorting-associated protein 29